MAPTDDSEAAEKVILAVMPHPDDLELTCAASMAGWIRSGATGHLLMATNGARGAKVPGSDRERMSATREMEQREAAAIIGFRGVEFLGLEDGEVEDNEPLRRELVRRIRLVRPDVVVAIDPLTVIYENSYVNHRDHRQLGMALLDSLYPMASNAAYFPEQVDEGLLPHKVPELLLTKSNHPNYFVDVTDLLDVRIEALRCHRSQLRLWPDAGEAIVRQQREEAASLGLEQGVQYAEAFRRIIASPLN